MIHFESDQSRELYDLKKDPGERHNLARQEPQKVKELWQELQDWIEKTTPPASE
jgi:arylsulfatase A-like enzyme